jgi:hypothetical protein
MEISPLLNDSLCNIYFMRILSASQVAMTYYDVNYIALVTLLSVYGLGSYILRAEVTNIQSFLFHTRQVASTCDPLLRLNCRFCRLGTTSAKIYIVTCTPIARQRVGKLVYAKTAY